MVSTWQVNEAWYFKSKMTESPLSDLKEIGMTLIKGATVVSNIFPSFKQSSLYEIKANKIKEISDGVFLL